MDILLVSPPVANFCQATAGISVLTSFLRARGWDACQWDLAITAFHHFHGAEVLGRCREKLEKGGAGASMLEVADRVARRIDEAKDALRRPGVQHDTETMGWAFQTIEDAGVVLSAASFGRYEHDSRHFAIPSALHSYDSLDAALSDPEQNPFLELFERVAIPRLRRERPTAVGVSISYYSQLLPAFTLVRLVRAHLPETRIILGGAFLMAVRGQLEAILHRVVPADCIYFGQGALGLDRWLRVAVGGETAPDGLPGCLVPSATGTFTPWSSAPPPPLDLADLPVPMWTADGLDLGDYLVPRYAVPLPLSTGCYWGRCVYCNISSQTDARYGVRPAALAVQDMQAILAKTGSSWFDLAVDSFKPADLVALACEMTRAGLEVEWGAEVLLDRGFTDEVVAALARSGCRLLRFGLESGSEATLKAMGKAARPAATRRILQSCRRHGIRTAVMLIAGFPTETQLQLRETFDFLVENRACIDFLTIHRYSLVPGSAMARDPSRFGILPRASRSLLSPSLPFTNANAVALRPEDLPRVVAAMRDGLREHYPDLDRLWTVAVGGWMTFPACCRS